MPLRAKLLNKLRRGVKQARADAEDMMSDMRERGSAAYDAAHDAAYSLEETLEDSITPAPIGCSRPGARPRRADRDGLAPLIHMCRIGM